MAVAFQPQKQAVSPVVFRVLQVVRDLQVTQRLHDLINVRLAFLLWIQLHNFDHDRFQVLHRFSYPGLIQVLWRENLRFLDLRQSAKKCVLRVRSISLLEQVHI